MELSDFVKEGWNNMVPRVWDLIAGKPGIFEICFGANRLPDNLPQNIMEAIFSGSANSEKTVLEFNGLAVCRALALSCSKIASVEEYLAIACKWMSQEELAAINKGTKMILVGAAKQSGNSFGVSIVVLNNQIGRRT